MVNPKIWLDLLLFRLHKIYNDPVDVALHFLDYICSNPLQRNRCARLTGNIFRIYIVLLCILSVIQLGLANDVWEFASTFEGLMIAIQVKYIKNKEQQYVQYLLSVNK